MRFHASDQTVASLVRTGQRVEDPPVRQIALQGMRGVLNQRYTAQDLRAVGWQAVTKIQKPEIYQISAYSEPSQFSWLSYLIVDRRNHLVYVHGSAD
jgi:hypothetical protein